MHVTNCSSIWVESSGNQELQVVLSVLVAESQSHTSHHLHETQMTDMEFWTSKSGAVDLSWFKLGNPCNPPFGSTPSPSTLHLDRPNLVVESLVGAHRAAISSILIALPVVLGTNPGTHQSLPDHEEVGWYPGRLGTIQTWRLHELPSLNHSHGWWI